MLAKSVIAVLLSLPATVAALGLLMAATPASSSLTMVLLLMFFPLYVGMVSTTYLLPDTRTAAAVLTAITGGGFGLIALLKFAGLSGL